MQRRPEQRKLHEKCLPYESLTGVLVQVKSFAMWIIRTGWVVPVAFALLGCSHCSVWISVRGIKIKFFSSSIRGRWGGRPMIGSARMQTRVILGPPPGRCSNPGNSSLSVGGTQANLAKNLNPRNQDFYPYFLFPIPER